jgi:hypothetical protein
MLKRQARQEEILKAKLLMAAMATVLCGVLALSGVAGARSSATTKVTIKYNGDGFQGLVKSSKPNLCANHRKVNVYRQKGNAQDPSSDTNLYTETASKQGDRYKWNTGNSGQAHGRFYARAGKIPGCKADSSDTIQT